MPHQTTPSPDLVARLRNTRLLSQRNQIALQVEAAEASEPVAYRYVHRDYAGRKISRYGTHAERVNGHDPIEVHPLYSHPQPSEAAERIVKLEEALRDLLIEVDDMAKRSGWFGYGARDRARSTLKEQSDGE